MVENIDIFLWFFCLSYGGFILYGSVHSVFSSDECSCTIHFNLFLGAKETYGSIVYISQGIWSTWLLIS